MIIARNAQIHFVDGILESILKHLYIQLQLCCKGVVILITRIFREKYPFTCSLYKVASMLNATQFIKSRFGRQVTEQHGHTRRGAMFAWQTAPHWLHIKLTVRCQRCSEKYICHTLNTLLQFFSMFGSRPKLFIRRSQKYLIKLLFTNTHYIETYIKSNSNTFF